MSDTGVFSAVLVGIDGSDAAIGAATWAVEEAISRSVPLVLISVMRSLHPSAEEYRKELHHADPSLRTARAAVEATGRPVKVDTEIATGQPAAVLLSQPDRRLMLVERPHRISDPGSGLEVHAPMVAAHRPGAEET